MSLRAVADSRYIGRFLIVAIVVLGFAAWSLYDGLIKYPKELERSELYMTLDASDPKQQEKAWRELALEKGWSQGIPKTAEEIREKILWQYGMLAGGLTLGLPMLVWCWRTRGTWIEATNAGLTTSWGQSLEFKNIISVNKKKWAKKGIAKVQYDDQGVQRTFILDDFKYERKPIDQMLRMVEAHLKPEQIIGGAAEKSEDEMKADEVQMEKE